jgi:hypothetical protein
MTHTTAPPTDYPLSDVPCPQVIDEIGRHGREDREGEVCGELMMAPAPAGEPGDDSYYCAHCGLVTRLDAV